MMFFFVDKAGLALYSYVLMKAFNTKVGSASALGAVDIGGTKIAVGVVDRSGRVLKQAAFPTEVAGGFDRAIEQIKKLLSECTQLAGVELCGVGIGCAGPVDATIGILRNANNLAGWEGGNPVEILSRAFGVPAAMENDADAAALGEMVWGAGKCCGRLVYVTVGTGIGVSVILDGRIYRGLGQCHPEIGHVVIDPGGPVCSCGSRGCWESCASGPAMTEWLNNHAPADYARENLTAQEICERAEAGDGWARWAVEHEAFYLGLGVANLVLSFAPDAIVLGGSVMKSTHLFMARIQEIVARNCTLVPYQQTQIRPSSLGADAALVGAAQVWRHRFETCGGALV
jgi:glucokinase